MHDEVTSEYLGAIWVQQGARPFRPRARRTLEAGGIMASRLIDRSRRIPSQESELLQQLLGLKQGLHTSEQLVGALNLQTKGGWAVVGFSAAAPVQPVQPGPGADELSLTFTPTSLGSLSLQAVGLRPMARVTSGSEALYCVIPDSPPAEAVTPLGADLREHAEQAYGRYRAGRHRPCRLGVGRSAGIARRRRRHSARHASKSYRHRGVLRTVRVEPHSQSGFCRRSSAATCSAPRVWPPCTACRTPTATFCAPPCWPTSRPTGTSSVVPSCCTFTRTPCGSAYAVSKTSTQLSLAKPEERLLLELEVRATVAA